MDRTKGMELPPQSTFELSFLYKPTFSNHQDEDKEITRVGMEK